MVKSKEEMAELFRQTDEKLALIEALLQSVERRLSGEDGVR